MQGSVKSKKDLEIRLQRLKKLSAYRNYLEQYPTDAALASEILFLAYLDGNIKDRRVGDFGSGNGILGIGAAYLGADMVHCVELDPEACNVIRENSASLYLEVHEQDMSAFSERVDTVVMNPPFGSVNKGADRIFLEKAVELSKVVYSLHNAKSADYVRRYFGEQGEITREARVKIRTPRLYAHHSSHLEDIDGIFFCTVVS